MSRAPTPVIFRQAAQADSEGIAAAFVETWRATYPGMLPDRALLKLSEEAQAGYWRRLAERGWAWEFVMVALDHKSNVLGFGSAGRDRTSKERRGEVYTLYVRPDWHGQGIGRALLCTLLLGLRDRDMNSAMLWVLAENPSRFFYERMGGKRTAERLERLWGKDVPQIGYAWPDLAKTFAKGGPCARP